MSSIILDVLGISHNTLFFNNKMNLFHSGDKLPFATVVVEDGITKLKVNSGEPLAFGTNISLGKYAKP